ncbi:hypothetical protein NLG97_g7745 [Lecanicillium saksenae]|uniref:Uncharacterized protein n=1 Tax=Lecanicillium saksenae TaxID=468837 RepID=A0ACC1QMI0_9HYPO|nr:hypothetical protein NLG97_g7745 [Lecanicillium saksenae]
MKFSAAYSAIIIGLAATVAAMPAADDSTSMNEAFTVLEARKGCSGARKEGDKCSGKKLGPQNSFHNCKNRDGKCCAKNKDGSGGLDANHGQGREDCGFCFTGKCKT